MSCWVVYTKTPYHYCSRLHVRPSEPQPSDISVEGLKELNFLNKKWMLETNTLHASSVPSSKHGQVWITQTFQWPGLHRLVATLHFQISRTFPLFSRLFYFPGYMEEGWKWNATKTIRRAFNGWYKSLWERQSAIIENKIRKLSVDLTHQFYHFAWVWIVEG